ncbi:Clp protease N-terminal domain-containing protein [Catenuloplanes atrovinosus]|uniref:ATP-dependent Clp protease ATP-binding subunit ClpA n=1 Tax=Catenuloplanes atrovinosus TaxID=137266 RepID=A0AAE4C878_9ACTN|nr:Clp protease N-terminal domain-containing protein [Catenuloplanes atrovinosus]MDR7274708.1 ATP-dependent Clp protease ATP-binding subunit ClpA [Catenuloplanes atrovinosus]
MRSPAIDLTDRVKRVLGLAHAEATAVRSPVIEPIHLILGVLGARGPGAQILRDLAGGKAVVGDAVRPLLSTGTAPSPANLPFTATSEAALKHAIDEARRFGDPRTGTDHLLLGLLRVITDPSTATPADTALGATLAAIGVDHAGAARLAEARRS